MKIKKALLFVILFMIGLICVNDKHVMGGEASDNDGVSLSPAYMDLGSIKDGTISFTISVMNEGKPVHLKAIIDNAEGVKIAINPNSFTLSENEQKDLTVTLTNDDTMRIGIYDLSIALLTEAGGQQSITAYGTNSLRLVFRKEGLALATCNVKDIAPVQKFPFYSILSNFYSKSKKVNVNIEIKNKATGEIVWEQTDKITMKPYPDTGFYGKVDTPAPTAPWQYGDYIYHLTARMKGVIELEYQTEFNVGEQKGKLESVTTKDVYKGDLAEFKAVIKNVGTQKLPVSVQICVKDKKHNLVYTKLKTDTLYRDDVGKIKFQWPTKYTKIGRYSIDYTVIMGEQKEAGTLYYEVRIPCWVGWFILSFLILVTAILIYLIMRKRRGIL